MDYYKLIDSQNIVGVIDSDCFRKYQKAHHIILYSNVENAQLVQYKDDYYKDDWLRPLYADVEFHWVKIIKITEEEYNALAEAIENGEAPVEEIIEPIEQTPDEPIVNPDDELTLDFIKESKINQMSKVCHDTITAGVTVALSDGYLHHFSLSVEDQIKIQALALKAQTGNESLPWHEDNKPCQFYSAADIMVIYNAMEQMQVYHTTYFNSLKMYIRSLDKIEDVRAVTYGMEIPSEYQSDVLKYLLAQ